MPAPARFDLSGIIEKIGPGGTYFKYARVVLFGFAGIFVILLAWFFVPSLRNLFTKKVVPTVQRPNCKTAGSPLPKGFQSWNFSFGNGVTGPKIQTATIDTLTPPQGSTQTLTLTIKNGTPVTKANAMVSTDNKSNIYDLTLNKGTLTDGTWIGIWKLDDTTNCIYHIDFDLESSSGNWTGALTFR